MNNKHHIPLQSKQNPNVIKQSAAISFSGPLPHPDMLAQYNNILPNAAERIMIMAENQANHRISEEQAVTDMQRSIVASQIKYSGRGQFFAFVLAILFLLFSVFLIYTGSPISGTILGTTDLAALVGLFISGSYMKTKQKPTIKE